MHFVYCWEIGADLGHITQLASIGQALQAHGHRVTAIIKDTRHAFSYLYPLGIAWYQAPLSTAPRPRELPLNHADILRAQGFNSISSLTGLIQAWRSLLQLLKPDRVLIEASPTAGLAARSLDLRVVSLDNGFFCPPISKPFPPLRQWRSLDAAQLLEREARVLEYVNQALNRLSLKPLSCFSALFDHETYWLTWPELNHFGYHSPERHLGPLQSPRHGNCLAWPEGSGKKVFAYLKPNCTESLPALEWCVANGFRVMAYLPLWPKELMERLRQTGRVNLSLEPLALDSILEACDFTLSHGGIGTVTHSLRAGKPLLLIPTHVEQFRTALAAVGQQLGLMPFRPAESKVFGFDIKQLDSCYERARQFSSGQPTGQQVMTRLVALLEAANETDKLQVVN
ncbi:MULTISPECIES: hypothetical protein [Pseudomonadales]|uniref:hypothetical protein n=1 Tax=Pseudomonadales TaxID=72274 RepID=UPI001AEFB859|nr:hypothetical protein [Pseudomonas khazarica]QTS88786.1 hypothetical protein JLK41_11760 [Pseudomonas khazarica]